MSVSWSYFDRFEAATDKYLPRMGEGETRATQTVTAVCKLVYKWYNDGDVYDNTANLTGWVNDLSSYANWLAEYAGAKDILDRIFKATADDDYEDILKDLADRLFDLEYLEAQDKLEKAGSVYKCEGAYRFVDYDEEEDWYNEEEDWYDEEEE